MSKNFYAIKQGNNVKNIIVKSWEECKKYTDGYPSIYKGFSDEISAKEYLDSISDEDVQRKLETKRQFSSNNKKARFIKKEDKALKEVCNKYDKLYEDISSIMDRLETASYTKANAYEDLDKIEATILEGLDILYKYVTYWEAEN